MAQEKFKYNINHQISFLPHAMSIADLEKLLEKEYAITRSTFYADRRIMQSDVQSIPVDRMEVYAGLFNVSIEQLIFKKQKIKSIDERLGVKRVKVSLN